MSFWDEIKNFTKPYSDDEDYDDYDDEMEDSFEEEAAPAERAPRFGRREAAPAEAPAFTPAPVNTTAFTPAAATGFSGQVVNTSNKVQLIYYHSNVKRIKYSFIFLLWSKYLCNIFQVCMEKKI